MLIRLLPGGLLSFQRERETRCPSLKFQPPTSFNQPLALLTIEAPTLAALPAVAAVAAAAGPPAVPFICANVNTEEREKSATMRKYEAQAAAVCVFFSKPSWSSGRWLVLYCFSSIQFSSVQISLVKQEEEEELG